MIKSKLPHLKSLILRFSLLLVLYALLRLGFYWVNQGLFPAISWGEWWIIMAQGARFDCVIILYLNALPFLMQVLPFPTRNNAVYKRIQKTCFILFNLFGLAVSLTDYGFYPFNLKRLDSEVLGLIGAIPTMALSFAADYWYFLILFFVLIYGLFLIYDKSASKEVSEFKFGPNVIAFFVVLAFMALGIRGGIQPRPIRPVMATNYLRLDLAPLVTNSPYTLVYSLFNRKLDAKHYFSNEEVDRLFPIKKVLSPDSIPTKRPNIVVLILESFSGVFVGHLGADTTFTPYLDSLSEKSLTCSWAFANGRRSSQGLVALTAGIPALMDDPFMYSPYLNNRIYGLPKLLNGLGYTSSFFNGSDKKMLGWTDYITAVGFDEYYSRDNYPIEGHYDGHWGIYDHHYLDYFIEEAKGFEQPFFSAFFTLSSHDPFGIPDSLKERFNTGITPYYDALTYADWAVGSFFKKAEKAPWFDNTIFIITADHTINAADKSPDKEYEMNSYKINRIGLYHIPALIYAPKLVAPGRIEKPVQQLDLFDAALHYAGYNGAYYSFGNAPLNEAEGSAFQYVKGVYQLIEGDYLFLLKEDKAYALYNYKNEDGLKNNILEEKPEEAKRLESKLKAIIQQHNNTLVENNMKL